MVTMIGCDASDDTCVIIRKSGLSWENSAFPIMVMTDDTFAPSDTLTCVCAYTRAHIRMSPGNNVSSVIRHGIGP